MQRATVTDESLEVVQCLAPTRLATERTAPNTSLCGHTRGEIRDVPVAQFDVDFRADLPTKEIDVRSDCVTFKIQQHDRTFVSLRTSKRFRCRMSTFGAAEMENCFWVSCLLPQHAQNWIEISMLTYQTWRQDKQQNRHSQSFRPVFPAW